LVFLPFPLSQAFLLVIFSGRGTRLGFFLFLLSACSRVLDRMCARLSFFFFFGLHRFLVDSPSSLGFGVWGVGLDLSIVPPLFLCVVSSRPEAAFPIRLYEMTGYEETPFSLTGVPFLFLSPERRLDPCCINRHGLPLLRSQLPPPSGVDSLLMDVLQRDWSVFPPFPTRSRLISTKLQLLSSSMPPEHVLYTFFLLQRTPLLPFLHSPATLVSSTDIGVPLQRPFLSDRRTVSTPLTPTTLLQIFLLPKPNPSRDDDRQAFSFSRELLAPRRASSLGLYFQLQLRHAFLPSNDFAFPRGRSLLPFFRPHPV